jgi:hypothetical protein
MWCFIRSSHSKIDPIDYIFNNFEGKSTQTSRKLKDDKLVNVKRKKTNEDKQINSYTRELIKRVVSTLKKGSIKKVNKLKVRKKFEKLKKISDKKWYVYKFANF